MDEKMKEIEERWNKNFNLLLNLGYIEVTKYAIKDIKTLLSKIRELEGEIKPRQHICIWCKKVLFTKPLGKTPTDDEAKGIAEHIMNCKDNPVVQKVKELENKIEEIKEYHRLYG